MAVITPKQCRAARQLMGWTQGKLGVATGLAASTIGNFEDEKKEKSLRSDSIELIRAALERAGIEFLDGQGVKLRCDYSKTYKGQNSCHDFFDDMEKEVKINGGSVLAFIKTHDILTKYSGEPERENNIERLRRMQDMADIKCLIADPPPVPELLGSCFEMRPVPKAAVSPTSFFVYADKLAFITRDDCLDFTVIVLHEAVMTETHKGAFNLFWDHASALNTQTLSTLKRRGEHTAFA